jgi:hypothetical protein
MSWVMTDDTLTKLTAGLGTSFTFGDLVRAAERDPHVRVTAVVDWFRQPAGIRDTGRRRCSSNALRGAKLYSRA